ncbi:MAG: hypothetical protein U1U88_001723 [Lawsonella clevelandensis]
MTLHHRLLRTTALSLGVISALGLTLLSPTTPAAANHLNRVLRSQPMPIGQARPVTGGPLPQRDQPQVTQAPSWLPEGRSRTADALRTNYQAPVIPVPTLPSSPTQSRFATAAPVSLMFRPTCTRAPSKWAFSPPRCLLPPLPES